MTVDSSDQYVGRLVLGRYRIVRVLAVGGMGRIYLARTEGAAGFVKPVVVKRVLPDLVGNDSMIKMFVREAKILSRMRHPGIVAVSDFAREGQDYVMAMEYVHGYNLSRWLRHCKETRGEFPAEVALQIGIDVLEALHYAHTLTSSGKTTAVVHRDVTPSNVLVDIDGHVKLLDFGIARSSQEMTEPDVDGPKIKGKFPYIAPEVFGGAEPSPQSDVYSTAVLLHEVISGKNELAGADMQTTLYNAIGLVPRRLDSIRMDVPKGVADAIAKGLAKKPTERFRTAQEFAAALRSARLLGSDEAREELRRTATADFLNPDFAGRQKIDDLSSLESSWKQSVPPIGASVPPERDLTPPTLTGTEQSSANATLAASRRTGPPSWIWVALASIVVATGVAASGWYFLHRPPTQNPAAQYVFIQGNVTPTNNPTVGPSPTVDASAGVLPTVPTPGVSAIEPGPGIVRDAGHVSSPPNTPHSHEGTHAAPDPTAVLTRTFGRQESRITHCFQENADDVTGTPDIAVRFEVDTDGHVTSAHLVPGGLESTRLAGCILGIARSVNFGAQPAHIAFRIPISVRRLSGSH